MRHTCSEDGCDRPAFGRGLCSLHYQKARYHGTLPTSWTKTCEQCGESYTDRKWNSRYCSSVCKERARPSREAPRRRNECEQCGVSLEDKRIDARFCSPKCSNDFRGQRARERRRANRKPCAHCGEPIPLNRHRFCSDACTLAHRRPEKYGLTRDELASLLAQHGVCAICQTDKWGKKGPQVDHCHDTGRVRGVLCNNCNQGLGRFNDDPARLRGAASYLEAPM